MIDTGTLNFLWSQAMVAGFAAAGVTHAVISPGSRSTPLALSILRQPAMDCTVAVDERSAAFFALGIAQASRRPVVLLATSGTAPANWLPAVIEASQSAVPLILISADRPPELQGCGANQTIDQIGLFGSHVRGSHPLGAPHPEFDPAWLHRLAARVVEQASWPHPGPEASRRLKKPKGDSSGHTWKQASSAGFPGDVCFVSSDGRSSTGNAPAARPDKSARTSSVGDGGLERVFPAARQSASRLTRRRPGTVSAKWRMRPALCVTNTGLG